MSFLFAEWKRKFSLSTYKNLRIRLGEMSFLKDFVRDTRGDLYPVREKSVDASESVKGNRYAVEEGAVSRLFCQFFPYATYEATFDREKGRVGFSFRVGAGEASLLMEEDRVLFACGNREERFPIPAEIAARDSLLVSCRPGAFDVYVRENGKPAFVCTVKEESFRDSNREEIFADGYVYLRAEGRVTVKEVLSYLDSGISLADIRPIRYESGEVISEGGRMFFTASIRLAEGAMQGIFSWIPGTAEIEMTGALYFDCGDGRWRNYLASVILYHREWKKWLLWTSSFENGHVLAYGMMEGDPRFGVNVADVTLMERAKEGDTFSDFVGFPGDEDPDLLYDEKNNRWLLAICRINPKIKSYVYMFFESDNPFKNFKYIGCGREGAETGGSFVNMNGELFFVCGNDFKKTSEYRIYSKSGMKIANFNYPDGGFRGWGSVFSIQTGSRTGYVWLTFDRHQGSDYKWSYGNLYCFEMIV